ncbi:MAG: SGNH/GDSL hydrolase family protein [Pyrinomonadaceae bacterium]
MKRLILLLSSILFCGLILLLFEAGTRVLVPGINFQDSDRSLLRPKAYGESYGWQPGATGICFGKRVTIDDLGFRKMSAPQSYDASWLILGDSVTFGVGVDTEETFVQLLQNNMTNVRLWNTAVIGYDTRNYKDTLNHFTVETKTIPLPQKVLLFLCLNDIDLNSSFDKDLSFKPFDSGYVESLLSFLRRKSKFYMFVKNVVFDRSRAYFQHDLQLYKEAGPGLAESLSILDEMNTSLRERNIELTVVITPYEYQLRKKEAQYLLPQKVLTTYFQEHGIPYIDTYEYFDRAGGDGRQYFLYGDFAHFSKKGHQVVFDLLKERFQKQ